MSKNPVLKLLRILKWNKLQIDEEYINVNTLWYWYFSPQFNIVMPHMIFVQEYIYIVSKNNTLDFWS